MKRLLGLAAPLLLVAVFLGACGNDVAQGGSVPSNDPGGSTESGPEQKGSADAAADAAVPDATPMEAGADAGDEISRCVAACALAPTPDCNSTCKTVCLSGKCISNPKKPFPWENVTSVRCSDIAVSFQTMLGPTTSGPLRACVID